LIKRIFFGESMNVELRAEVFNVTNTPIFTGISNRALGYDPPSFTGSTAPTGFGEYTATKSDARVMQFALRFEF